MFAQLHSCFLIFYIYSVNYFSLKQLFFSLLHSKAQANSSLLGSDSTKSTFKTTALKTTTTTKIHYFFFFCHTRIASAEDYLNN